MQEVEITQADREAAHLSHHEQMLDAQKGCVPCKLCGGKAIISDAGLGAGYYIKCSGDLNFREYRGCLIDERRAGGWAYNVRDWWNRLHTETLATQPPPSAPVGEGRVPIAWRWRYIRNQKPGGWTLRASPIEPSNAGPGCAGIEVQPLYATPAPVSPPPSIEVEGLRAALHSARIWFELVLAENDAGTDFLNEGGWDGAPDLLTEILAALSPAKEAGE